MVRCGVSPHGKEVAACYNVCFIPKLHGKRGNPAKTLCRDTVDVIGMCSYFTPKPENLFRCFCSGATSASSAEAGTVTTPRAVAETNYRVSEAAAGTQADVPETTDEPVSLPRRHGVLRMQGRRLSAAGDPLDKARTSSCRQSQVSFRHIFAQPCASKFSGSCFHWNAS